MREIGVMATTALSPTQNINAILDSLAGIMYYRRGGKLKAN